MKAKEQGSHGGGGNTARREIQSNLCSTTSRRPDPSATNRNALPPWKIDLSTTRDSSKGISRLLLWWVFFKGKTKTIRSGTHTPEKPLENRESCNFEDCWEGPSGLIVWKWGICNVRGSSTQWAFLVKNSFGKKKKNQSWFKSLMS